MSAKSESNEPMSFAVFEDDAVRKQWALRAEKREAARQNVKPTAARESVARKWGVSYWTLRNWHLGRLKDLRSAIRDRIDAGIVRELEAEIQRLTHELEMALQCGARAGSDKVIAIRTQLARLNELFDEALR